MTKTFRNVPFRRSDQPHLRRRSAWRQSLVDAERGLVIGFRSDSAILGHLFAGSIVLIAGCLFGLEAWQWICTTLSFTMLLTGEMIRQAVKTVCNSEPLQQNPQVQSALGMLSGAMTIASVGAAIVVLIIFWQRFEALFGGPG